MAVTFRLNGSELRVEDDGAGRTLLDALRAEGGLRSAKDGCAPQGQCGCCTVLVDGRARVACVTPLRRVAGRDVETVEGLDPAVAATWAEAFVAHGASQCGFCTPGIVMRLEDRRRRGSGPGRAAGASAVEPTAVRRALAAHLCRCTGWQGITEAAVEVLGRRPRAGAPGTDARSRVRAEEGSRRAAIESHGPQHIDAGVALGGGGFAADTVPPDALVAVLDAHGSWVVGESPADARQRSAKLQGRRTTMEAVPPLQLPDGEFDATLRTSWVEPAYLETDASWCVPGGQPASPLANGGAFGGKVDSPLPEVARRLADEHGRPVLALWSREDVVRLGPKRPPVAIGMRADGTGMARVARTGGIGAAMSLAAPGLVVQEVDLAGPPTSAALRAAGWAEAFCAAVAAGAGSPLGGPDGDGFRVSAPGGGWARVRCGEDALEVVLGPGDPLDEVVLASFATGAAHMAAGWVCSEGLAVDADGEVGDLTIRSFGVLSAEAMPRVSVTVDPQGAHGPPVAIGDAVFVAAAAAIWQRHGWEPAWPLGRPVW